MATAAIKPVTGDLVIDSPEAATMRVRLEKQQYRLGRAPANELAFPGDHKLSREHLMLERVSEGWTLHDLNSRNGTFINGVRVAEPRRLAHGDRITAGHLTIRYDTRAEFKDARLNEIRFVEQEFPAARPTVSLNLKSALERSTDLAGTPTLENTHLGTLVRAARELAGQGSLDKLFELTLSFSLDAVKATRGVVMTREANGDFRTRAIRGEGFSISSMVRDLVTDEGKSLLVRDARSDQDFASRTSILMQQIRSILAVPLQTDKAVIGLLYLDSLNFSREFTVEDLNLVTVMANIAAIRIEHARLVEQEESRKLIDRELERAADIQRSLLPSQAPEIGGFELAGYNAPCRTVGGDYYDFLSYPDGRVALLIGDVSGKGLGAALLMSSLQARSQVFFENPDDLAAQVSKLNRSVAGNCPENCFITFFVTVLNPADGELTYCNAGHNPPLLIRQNGEVELLEATGIPLGISRGMSYQQNSCRIEKGDILVLFSDGVTEARGGADAEQEFGEERLISAVKKERDRSAAEVIEGIRGELLAFSNGAPASDDITLVLARRR
jgi:sigma-B regulation protein RsbU (phosphoserine phosphatase)